MIRPTDEQLQHLGASMREIDPSSLQPDEDGERIRWFLGEHGTELFSWALEGKPPHHLQLIFSRVSVEWSVPKGLVTGTFSSVVATAGGRYDAYLLTVGASADVEVCQAALILLRAAQVASGVAAELISVIERTVPAG